MTSDLRRVGVSGGGRCGAGSGVRWRLPMLVRLLRQIGTPAVAFACGRGGDRRTHESQCSRARPTGGTYRKRSATRADRVGQPVRRSVQSAPVTPGLCGRDRSPAGRIAAPQSHRRAGVRAAAGPSRRAGRAGSGGSGDGGAGWRGDLSVGHSVARAAQPPHQRDRGRTPEPLRPRSRRRPRPWRPVHGVNPVVLRPGAGRRRPVVRGRQPRVPGHRPADPQPNPARVCARLARPRGSGSTDEARRTFGRGEPSDGTRGRDRPRRPGRGTRGGRHTR